MGDNLRDVAMPVRAGVAVLSGPLSILDLVGPDGNPVEG
jgi:hypothetical protein